MGSIPPPPRIPFPNFLLLHSSEFNTYHRQSWPSHQQNGIQSARDKLTMRSKASVQSLLSFRTLALPDRVTQSIDAGVGSPIPQHPSSRRYRSGLTGTPNTPKSGRSCPSRLLMAQKGVFLARTLTPTAVRSLKPTSFSFPRGPAALAKDIQIGRKPLQPGSSPHGCVRVASTPRCLAGG